MSPEGQADADYWNDKYDSVCECDTCPYCDAELDEFGNCPEGDGNEDV